MLIELTGVLKRRRKELNSQSAFDAFQLVVKENNEDAYKDFLLCERSARSGFVRRAIPLWILLRLLHLRQRRRHPVI
jgi:hypothetical protein